MSRAKSPRAAIRGLGFDEDKIRAFGIACRLARQYFHGGQPPEGVEHWKDDPNYMSSWNMKLSDVQTYTGVPISSISEVENHASYTIGLDTAVSLTLFYYENSKNGHLLAPWLDFAVRATAFLTPSEDIVDRVRHAGYKDAIALIEEIKQGSLQQSEIPKYFKETDSLRNEIPIESRPHVSKDFVNSLDFLIREWARLTDSSEELAIRVSRMPIDELEKLKNWYQSNDQ